MADTARIISDPHVRLGKFLEFPPGTPTLGPELAPVTAGLKVEIRLGVGMAISGIYDVCAMKVLLPCSSMTFEPVVVLETGSDDNCIP